MTAPTPGAAWRPPRLYVSVVDTAGRVAVLEVKVKRAREFLEHKDKVQVNVLFRGRELAHIDEGRKVMDEVLQALEDVAKVEKNPSMEGKRMTAIVAPRV